ncbi:MAG: serine dehydratase subunit alpha family protein [Bacilli bacterium]|nr:serine dehydratase subunit alpha family protein [Bacilli bacterium]
MEKLQIDTYTEILKKELEVATGCTEPVAVSFCAAKARCILGKPVDKVHLKVSTNIYKNAAYVYIPGTNLYGVIPSCILGILGGDAERELQVLENISNEVIMKTKELLNKDFVELEIIDNDIKLYIQVTVYHEDEYAQVEIKHKHTNITRITKNGKILYQQDDANISTSNIDYQLLNIKDIYTYAKTCDYTDLLHLLNQQITYNFHIAQTGLQESCGLNVGSTIIHTNNDDIITTAIAYTASASDARMSGVRKPVVTNSGSGNQGITVSVPLIVYAKKHNLPNEALYRALILSNLIAIHLKVQIGRLSYLCGAVFAAAGASCGLCFLKGGNSIQIEDTLKIMLADLTGILCDGAKCTCALKVASVTSSAFRAVNLALNNQSINNHVGIISNDIEDTIRNIGYLGKSSDTDYKIVEILKGY